MESRPREIQADANYEGSPQVEGGFILQQSHLEMSLYPPLSPHNTFDRKTRQVKAVVFPPTCGWENLVVDKRPGVSFVA
jgi:hypothetical protein